MASLWKHPNSRFWTACYTDKDGRQVKRSTKQTERKKAMLLAVEWENLEARARNATVSTLQIQKVLNDLVTKVTGESTNTPTIEKYLTDWLRSLKHKNSEGTIARYSLSVKKFLEYLGTRRQALITTVTPDNIEAFLNARIDQGVAPKTASIDLKTLSTAFQRAERYGMILKNPVLAVDLPKVVSSEREIFSPEQVAKLLSEVGQKSEWFTLILLGYFTGARLGDCATLKWKDVDMKTRVIIYKQKKTSKTVRVPMVEELHDHFDFIIEFMDSAFVCPESAKRSQSGDNNLSMSFTRIVKNAGIDSHRVKGQGKLFFNKLTFHSLRHSFNSAMAEAGVSQEIRMKLTGHSSFGMNDRYTHTGLKPLEDAVSFLPSVMTIDVPDKKVKTSKTKKHPAS